MALRVLELNISSNEAASTNVDLHSHAVLCDDVGYDEEHLSCSGGCHSACPKCLRTCVLNTSHYGPHECSEGHTWN